MKKNIFFLYTELITRRPLITILILLVIVAAVGSGAQYVVLDNDVRQFFSKDSPDAIFLEKYQSIFGTDETSLVVLLDARKSTPESLLELVEEVSELAKTVEGVANVDSMVDTSIIHSVNDDLIISPAFGKDSEIQGSYQERMAVLHNAALGGDRLLSKDGLVTLVVVKLELEYRNVELLGPPIEALKAKVDQAVAKSNSKIEAFYGGVPFTRYGAITSMMEDMLQLFPITLLVIIIFLFWMFRRKHAVLLPVFAILLSAVCTLGVLGFLGMSLNPLSMVFPILILVIAVADGIHFLVRYHEERSAGASYRRAVMISGGRIGMACFLTSFTTAIGFASLTFTSMTILQSFGVVVTIGVCFAFVIVVTVLPAGLAASKSPPAKPTEFVARRLSSILKWMLSGRRPEIITLIGLVLAVGGLYFAASAKVDNFLIHSLPEKHEFTTGNKRIDELMPGIVPVEFSFVGDEDDFKNPENLRRIERVIEFANSHNIHGMAGLPALMRELNRNIGDVDDLPSSQAAISQLLLLVEDDSNSGVSRLVNEDYSHARVFGNSPDIGAMGFIKLRKKIEAYSETVFEGTTIKGHVTGVATVAAAAFTNLVKELLLSLLSALIVIMTVVALVFRSIKMAIAGLLSNTLPLVLGMAWYGITDDYLNPAPAVVFSIALGIAVDDTIHVLARYREELTRCTTHLEAIIQSVVHSLGAIVITSFILAAGFSILGFSSFPGNRQFGVLGAVIILLALATDLIFTPVCLYLLKPGTPSKDSAGTEPL